MKKPCLPDLFNPIVFQISKQEYIGGSEVQINKNFIKIESALYSMNSIGAIKYSLQSEDHDGWVLASDGRCLPKNAFPQLQRIDTTVITDDTTHFSIPPIGYLEGNLCDSRTVTSITYTREETVERDPRPVRVNGFPLGSGKMSTGVPYKISYSFYENPKKKITAYNTTVKKRYLDVQKTESLFSDSNLFGGFEGQVIIAPDNGPDSFETKASKAKNIYRDSWIEIEFDVPVPANKVFFAIENVAAWQNMKITVSGGTASILDFNIIDNFGKPEEQKLICKRVIDKTKKEKFFPTNSKDGYKQGTNLANDGESIKQWCRLKGYDNGKPIETRQWDSPGDNRVVKWNKSKKKFETLSGSEYNNYVYKLECVGKIIPCVKSPDDTEPRTTHTLSYSNDGNLVINSPYKNTRGNIIGSWSENTVKKLRFSATQDIRDMVVFMLGEAFPYPEIEEVSEIPEIKIEQIFEKAKLNGFVYVGPSFPTFVEYPFEECPSLFEPEKYFLECDVLTSIATTTPYNSVYFTANSGISSINWSNGIYTDFVIQTDYDYKEILFGLDDIKKFMKSRFPLTVLNESNGYWIGKSPDPYIKVRLTSPTNLRVNVVSGVPVSLPLIARGTLPSIEGQIDWGDGSTSYIFPNQNPTHVYTSSGNYTVTFRGVLREMGWLSNTPSNNKNYFTGVSAWGDSGLSSVSFEGASITVLNSNLPTSVKSLKNLFKNCNSVPSNISQLSVSGIEIFDGIFYGYTGTTNVDINSWNVTNAKSMKESFSNITSNATPIISSWNVSGVKDMSSMFAYSNIVPVISTWNVGNVTTMESMFLSNQSGNINLSGWKPYKLENVKYMFSQIINSNINLNSWVVSSVRNFDYMFSESIAINPNVSNWDVSNALSIEGMFYGTVGYTPNVTNWNTKSVLNAKKCFSQMQAGLNITVTNWNLSSCIYFDEMFMGSASINPNITNWNFAGLRKYYLENLNRDTGLFNIFNGCGITKSPSQDNLEKALNTFVDEIFGTGIEIKVQYVNVGTIPGFDNIIDPNKFILLNNNWIIS